MTEKRIFPFDTGSGRAGTDASGIVAPDVPQGNAGSSPAGGSYNDALLRDNTERLGACMFLALKNIFHRILI